MKHGQLFSVLSVLLLLVVILLFNAHERAIKNQQEFRIERARLTMLDTFADGFATRDIPNMLASASRLALVKRSLVNSSISYSEMAQIMRTGSYGGVQYFPIAYGTDNRFVMVLSALPFAANEPMSFNYTLVSVSQSAPDALTLNFVVEHSVSGQNATWSDHEVPYSVDVSVYGLMHPTYGLIIDNRWNTTSQGCLVQLYFSSASGCSANMAPPPSFVS